MIDLHSHILPEIDDGAQSIEDSIEMARMAVADGIEVMACTPHFMPGMFDNEIGDVRKRVTSLNNVLMSEGINLALVMGSDAHIRPDFLSCLRGNLLPTIHGSRYVLFEPPHTVLPQRMEELLFNITVAGYVPILTHPERLKWIEQSYESITDLSRQGVWMQITAGSLTGRFGKRAKYWAQRMLAEGLVDVLATDAHNTSSRPPLLSEARDMAAAELGVDEATNLVVTRPECVLENMEPDAVPLRPQRAPKTQGSSSLLRRLFGNV
jgi:protein-tyrosine phosphatase